jgi:hypothetical protein
MHHAYNGGFAHGVDRLTIGDLLLLLLQEISLCSAMCDDSPTCCFSRPFLQWSLPSRYLKCCDIILVKRGTVTKQCNLDGNGDEE